MDTLLLASEKAGSVLEDAVADARAELARAGDVEVVATKAEEDVDRALDRRQGRRVVVAGGDGTLNLVVHRLWRRKQLAATEVGLLPMGTCNDFARHLQIPLDPVAAAKSIVDGQPRPIDLLRHDHGGVVLNATHLGVGAEATGKAIPLKPYLRRFAFPVGSIAAWVAPSRWRLHVDVDDQVLAHESGEYLVVAIGNGSSVGGGTRLFPQAEVDDGALDVLVVARSLRRTVRRARGRAVTVYLEPGVQIPVNADGELAALSGQRSWWVEAGALTLVCPPPPG